MTSHLQSIASAWNFTGLPSSAVTTIQLLNSSVAVPVVYPNLPGNAIDTSAVAYAQSGIVNLRRQYQADVIVLFTGHMERCGATKLQWANGNFVPNVQGLDLRYRNQWYLSVVNPICDPVIASHEFGHLLGGGHTNTGSRLYSDGRAFLSRTPLYYNGVFIGWLNMATALGDPSDLPGEILSYFNWYSGDAAGGHNNARTFGITARSVANYYEYPSGPPILNPSINVTGFNLGCVNGIETRHDLYWSDDPATNVVITHYEIWKSQPVGQPFIYGWTVYGPFSQSYVSGATARARAKACSGAPCSAMSVSYYDAVPACSGFLSNSVRIDLPSPHAQGVRGRTSQTSQRNLGVPPAPALGR